jgi:L-ascorbate metabolism protein UlaG (beta-lactamase superfamily)
MTNIDAITIAAGGESDLARGSIFFNGTATVIIRYAGFTILTDPNFLHRHDKVRLGYGLSSRRLTDPALDIEDLPPIDLVVLSHLHDDHFDHIAEEGLNKTLPIITTRHAATYLAKKGFKATHPLATWQSFQVHKGDVDLQITSTPGRHGPGLLARFLPSVMGSILEFRRPGEAARFRHYITGDTLIFNELREIPTRYPDSDLALLHLGGTKALGVLLTMDAKQGVEALRIVNPRTAIPIHYNDYTVFRSPLSDFQKAVADAGLADRVHYLDHGQTYDFEVPIPRPRAAR